MKGEFIEATCRKCGAELVRPLELLGVDADGKGQCIACGVAELRRIDEWRYEQDAQRERREAFAVELIADVGEHRYREDAVVYRLVELALKQFDEIERLKETQTTE